MNFIVLVVVGVGVQVTFVGTTRVTVGTLIPTLTLIPVPTPTHQVTTTLILTTTTQQLLLLPLLLPLQQQHHQLIKII